MKFISAAVLPVVLFSIFSLSNMGGTSQPAIPTKDVVPLFGFQNSADETALESRFLAVPDPKLAEEHLRILTQSPHMAGTPEDKATAAYVRDRRIPRLDELPGRNQRGHDRARRSHHARPHPRAGQRRSLPG